MIYVTGQGVGKELGVYGEIGDPNLPPPVHYIPGSCPCFLSFLPLALNIRHCSIICCISHASYPFTTPASPLSSPTSGPLAILPGLSPPSPSEGQKDSRRTRANSLPVLASNHYTKIIKACFKRCATAMLSWLDCSSTAARH